MAFFFFLATILYNYLFAGRDHIDLFCQITNTVKD